MNSNCFATERFSSKAIFSMMSSVSSERGTLRRRVLRGFELSLSRIKSLRSGILCLLEKLLVGHAENLSSFAYPECLEGWVICAVAYFVKGFIHGYVFGIGQFG